jgi:hypothetical protein
MAEFSLHREERRGAIRYVLEGVFHGQASFELLAALSGESGPVELDFSRVRQCFDFGLAALATELRRPQGPAVQVTLIGLGLHHRRLLSYFGLELPRAAVPHDDLVPDPLPPLRSLAPA